MPTYDYQCKSCAHPYTAMHKISESAPPCPECGSGEVKKLLSAPAVHGSSSSRQEMAPCGVPMAAQGCGSGMCGHSHH